MLMQICVSKIHRATVTQADLNYVGSITIDQELMEAAGIKPYQVVRVTSLANGTLWQTYALPGEKGRGDIVLNGPPARHFQPGDIVIILADAFVTPEEARELDPTVVFVDEENKITSVEHHKGIVK